MVWVEKKEGHGLLTLAGFIEGPVYTEPVTTNATVTTASSHILRNELRGPLSMITRTRKEMMKVKTPSAIAPVCGSTFKEGPPSMCLYCCGMTSLMASAPPTAPKACGMEGVESNVKLKHTILGYTYYGSELGWRERHKSEFLC